MVNKILLIVIVCFCFSTKPLFAQTFFSVEPMIILKGSSLLLASRYNDTETLSSLLENGADVNYSNRWGYLSLIVASKFGALEAVNLLLDAGADVNAVHAPSGWNSLMFAVWNSRLKVVESLLEAGANVNYQSRFGYTALNYARQKDHTAFTSARRKDHIEILKLLEEAGATE